jgi:predicted DNA-binding ribbon-helix-helix protein
MCRIFSAQTAERYAYQTRSIRLGGHATSIRLEAAFWDILEEIALLQNVTLGRFLSKLHDEVLEFNGETMNFTSLLRCACLTYLSDVRGQEEGETIRREAVVAFHHAAE